VADERVRHDQAQFRRCLDFHAQEGIGCAQAFIWKLGLDHLMTKRTCSVRAIWDPEARVYYSESDILGLHIETKSLDEFEEVMMAEGVNLVLANHVSPEDLASAIG
jgi:hypothetical protein